MTADGALGISCATHSEDDPAGVGGTEAFCLELEGGGSLMALAAPAGQTGRDRGISRACIRHIRQEARRQKPAEFSSSQEYLGELLIRAASRLGAPRRASSGGEEARGPSCVAALFKDGQLYVGHLGNCRAYLCRGGKGTQLTTDHTVAQEAVDRTEISARELRQHPGYGVVTRWIGLEGDRGSPDVRETAVPLQPGDAVVLVNEGVHRLLDDGVLAQTVLGQTDSAPAAGLVVDKAHEVMASGSPPSAIVGLVGRQGEGAGSPVPVDVEELRTGEVSLADAGDEPEAETPVERPAADELPTVVDTREPAVPPEPFEEVFAAPQDSRGRSRTFYILAVVVLAILLGLLAWWKFFSEESQVDPRIPGQVGEVEGEAGEGGEGEQTDQAAPAEQKSAGGNVEAPRQISGQDEGAGAQLAPVAPSAALQRCTRLLDEAAKRDDSPCSLLGSYDKEPLVSSCYQTEERRARELWATRKNELDAECAEFEKKEKEREQAELRASCLDRMEKVMKVAILTDSECRLARIEKDKLK